MPSIIGLRADCRETNCKRCFRHNMRACKELQMKGLRCPSLWSDELTVFLNENFTITSEGEIERSGRNAKVRN